MLEADFAWASLAVLHTIAWARHVLVEVHAVDARAQIVLDTKVDVFRNATTKATVFTEVPLAKLVFLHCQPLLQNRLGILAMHSHATCDHLVTADAERPDRHPALEKHGLLLGELLQDLGSARGAIATLATPWHTRVRARARLGEGLAKCA